MLFLLHIQTHPRPELTSEQRADFRERESAAAVDLMGRGILRRMFRCAGSNLSYSIWEADTLEQLDAAIRTLPAFPSILHVTVTPLIKHPVEDAYEPCDRTPELAARSMGRRTMRGSRGWPKVADAPPPK